jgi:hypothetical protein
MAAPVAAFVQLPDDTGNTGKKVRTQTRVVGSNTVHEHYFVQVQQRDYVGVYWGSIGNQTMPITAQNGTTSGNWWLFNPIGSTVKSALRRFSSTMNFNALAVDLVPGQFRMSLFTYTGTPSGAALTMGKSDSTMATPQTSWRTASTGMTITLGATIYEEQGPILPLATGSGVVCGPYVGIERNPDIDEGEIVLRAGEGVVDWSALALTTANRRATTNIGVSEFS